jgi:quinolinate synthase
MSALANEIRSLAKKKNAIILAHNYQLPEIQDVADFCGDSLELARLAASNNAGMIIFCGVHFMAESAAMLAPEKKVILPELSAGCPMADMAEASDVLEMKKNHPDAAVVTYINSSAAVKAVSDVCCTSANAVRVVQSINAKKIIFVPDRNLGHYVSRFVDKEMILWEGFCPTHERLTVADIEYARKNHPDAVVMVHPECTPQVIDVADEVRSTGGMIAFAKTTQAKKIILGTEKGMIHRLKKEAPHIEYFPASESLVCPNMKKINLIKLHDALDREETVMNVEFSIRERAVRCLEKMLELSQ